MQAFMGKNVQNPMMGGLGGMPPIPPTVNPPVPPNINPQIPPPPHMAPPPNTVPSPNMPFMNPNPMMGSFGGASGMNPQAMAQFQAQMMRSME